MDEYIITNDEFVEESYESSYDDVTLDDVDTYLESVKEDIINAVDLYDDMVQEGYEYEDMSVEDLEMFIESSIDNYNDGVDLYNTMIMESDDNVTDNVNESGDDDIDIDNLFAGSPWDPRRKYKIKVDEKRFKEDDDLRRKRRDNNDYVDDIDTLPSRDYIKAKELRGHYSKDPRRNKAMISMIDQNMKDIVSDARKARKANNHVKEYSLTDYLYDDDDFVEESARRDISPYDRAHRYREDPRETLKRHEALDRNSIDPTGRYYEIKADKEHIKEDDDLRRKRLKNKVYKDNIDKLPSREYIKAKELRDFYTDLDKKSYRSSDPNKSTYYKDSIDILNGNMKDIVDAHKARKEADAYSKMTPLARAVNKKYEKFANEYALNDYRDNELDLELEEPLTAQEFFDESYEPDNTPIIPYSPEGIYLEEKSNITVLGAGLLGAGLGALIGAGISLIDKLITDKKYGRFPKDMKRLYQIVESADFEASENKRSLRKALKAIEKDLRWMLGGMGSRWKITVNEATEIRKFKRHVDDLYTRGWMLSRDKETSNIRRVPERIKDMIDQGNKVLNMLNKSVYKESANVTTEWMV